MVGVVLRFASKAAGAMLKNLVTVHTIPHNRRSVGDEGIPVLGVARMGVDPTQSVLNHCNHIHDVINLRAIDVACMTSANCVNPSTT